MKSPLYLIKAKVLSVRRFLDRHRVASLLIAGAIGITVVANVTMAILGQPVATFIPDIIVKKREYYSPLTGVEVKDQKASEKPITAVMIENSPDARPQSGLKHAEVVYEAIAEGGITRFLALYQQNKPQLVGPVRSVRMYYVDWYAPWQASLAHVGGSFEALKVVRNGKHRDLDQFFNDGAYWRASDRYAPHNVYTSFAKLDALNKTKKYTSSSPEGFERDDIAPAKKLNAKKVTINISDALYNSEYRYDGKTKRYTRLQAGAIHSDREAGAITAKVVIALRVDMRHVMEDGYRESITTTGKGSAIVFQNGTAKKVTWSKKSRQAQLQFSVDGEPFELARGTTWVAAVPRDGGSVSWQ